MDETEIYVEHARIEAAATHLRNHKKTFDEVLAQLESDLSPMVATWTGEARNMYLGKKANWDRAARDLTALLAHIGTVTEQAHAGYTGAVTELSALWT